jgi:ergothioneine biosynthesis protein EgtB
MPAILPAGHAAPAARYAAVRAQTEALAAPLTVEDCALQSMLDASPVKWHLGHTTWFFETFVLERALPGFTPFRTEFRTLFNSYYVGVGPRHPRPERGLLSRPSLQEVLAYRASVDRRMEKVLDDARVAQLIELGLQHEQQHQELILTDVKHLLSRNPLQPAYSEKASLSAEKATAMRFTAFPEGVRQIGHDRAGFAFDNETPRHRVYLRGYAVADRLVTNREYQAFIADGGYERPELWLSVGRAPGPGMVRAAVLERRRAVHPARRAPDRAGRTRHPRQLL